MKKVIYSKYGHAAVLQLVEVKIPIVNSSELLIKVKAVSISPLDWKIFQVR